MRGGSISIAAFVEPLIADMKEALELSARTKEGRAEPAEGDARSVDQETDAVARELRLSPAVLATIVRGDSAFRSLHYFLELARPLLEKIQPRSLLSMRAAR
jgi:hypothetical protein